MGTTDKTCSKCSLAKPLSEFSLVHPRKRNGKLRADCKECVRKRGRAYYERDPDRYLYNIRKVHAKARAAAKQYVSDYLSSHPCVDCGETDPVVMEFDHVRGEKINNVSAMVAKAYRLWRIEQEIEKCDVRCANCHRKITHSRRKESVAGRTARLLTSNQTLAGSTPAPRSERP